MPTDSDNNNNQQTPLDATPPNPAPQNNDLEGLKTKNQQLLGEKKEWQAKYGDLERQLNLVTQTLGDISPESLEKLKASEENYKRVKTESDRILSEERAKIINQYEPQLKELSNKLQSQEKLLTQKLQSDALRSLHSANQGKEFEAFCAILNSQFSVEFEQVGVDFNQIPQYKPAKIANKDGTPIFIEGKEASPEDVLLQIRQGHYGQAIAACFEPWNQSNGGVLPRQVATNGGKTVRYYPRNQKSIMLAGDKTGEIARGISDGSIQFVNN
jgi:hypothetical protein